MLGGGFIGCEIASMAAMLGVKVTIVELLADILMLLDADLRGEVRAHMEKALGIRVLTGKPLADISADAQRRQRPLRRRNAARPTCCSTPSAAGR